MVAALGNRRTRGRARADFRTDGARNASGRARPESDPARCRVAGSARQRPLSAVRVAPIVATIEPVGDAVAVAIVAQVVDPVVAVGDAVAVAVPDRVVDPVVAVGDAVAVAVPARVVDAVEAVRDAVVVAVEAADRADDADVVDRLHPAERRLADGHRELHVAPVARFREGGSDGSGQCHRNDGECSDVHVFCSLIRAAAGLRRCTCLYNAGGPPRRCCREVKGL